MVTPALSASRAVTVLDWIVGHPGEAFTLSELSRALNVNVPSLMAVLQSLTDAGYLARHPTRKSYEAGPALLAVAKVINSNHPTLDILDRELAALAERVEGECFASVLIGRQAVIVADAGRPGSMSMPIRVGLRFPMMAPVGHIYMAWSSPEEIEEWITRAETDEQKLDRALIEESLEMIRRRGFALTLYQAREFDSTIELDRLSKQPYDDRQRELVRRAMVRFSQRSETITPESGKLYNVSTVAAPVFNPQSKVVMAITINGFHQIEGRTLFAHAERLQQTARLLTKQGGGIEPLR